MRWRVSVACFVAHDSLHVTHHIILAMWCTMVLDDLRHWAIVAVAIAAAAASSVAAATAAVIVR